MAGIKNLMLAGVAMLAIPACSEEGKLEIRSIPSPIAPAGQPVPERIAEARGYFALDNVGLALEAFRKALRDDPTSVDALNGIAACYDRMGRFDLSRRHYEMALAIAPGDARLYASLALSLDLQGKVAEAAAVRTEMHQRLASAALPSRAEAAAATLSEIAPATPPARVSQAEARLGSTAQSVTVALPPARAVAASSVVVRGTGSVTVALPPPRTVAAPTGPRLERLSSGQVALITSGRPAARPPVRIASAGRPASGPAPIVLLNAARRNGLAARTRLYLAQKGWRRIEIGDAPQVAARSTILYPATRRAQAARIAEQFGFALRHGPSSADRLTILLGHDAAARRWLGTKSA